MEGVVRFGGEADSAEKREADARGRMTDSKKRGPLLKMIRGEGSQ